MRVLIVYPNLPMMLVAPLSIAVFTWIARQEGCEVALFDTTQYGEGDLSSPENRVKYLQARNLFSESNLNLLKSSNIEEEFREVIETFGPDLILFSFTEDALKRALQLLRISNTFDIPTVVGGVLATAAPDWLLSFPEVHVLGVGEGEETIRDIIRRIKSGEDMSGVQNLCFKKVGGSIQRGQERQLIKLDDYSTDFSLFSPERFERPMGGMLHRALPVETYRGCPHCCTYCNSPMHNKRANGYGRVYLRRRSIDGIRRELMHLLNTYGVNLYYFVDDSFLARPKREIDEFIEMYQDIKVPFWFNTRPEHCSFNVLKRLKDVGLFRVSFGIESGNEQFRRERLGRNITNDRLVSVFNAIDESGIQYSINCIIGFPYETREHVFDTIRLARRIRGYDSITVSIYTPYRGTVLREEAIRNGWLDPAAMTTHTTATSMLNMPDFTAKQIDGLMQTFPLYVEFDESEWPMIERVELFQGNWEEALGRFQAEYARRRWGKDAMKSNGLTARAGN